MMNSQYSKDIGLKANHNRKSLVSVHVGIVLRWGVLVAVVSWFLLYSSLVNGETVVTTYITKVQEERQDTRWTLTQWLLIKERMRLMDVWLAMFSEPKTARFRPEISLAYYKNQTAFSHLPLQSYQGTTTRGQLWLTNLVSSTVGVRTLNIDLGGEFQREEHTLKGTLVSGLDQTGMALVSPGSSRLQSFMGNLRLFGKHVQDSSLILKYGEYRYQGFDPTARQGVESIVEKGPQYGGELTLYMSNWFGIEGNYSVLGQEPSRSVIGSLGGDYGEALVFIEISVLRLVGGSSLRSWSQQKAEGIEATKQTGVLGGLKLNL